MSYRKSIISKTRYPFLLITVSPLKSSQSRLSMNVNLKYRIELFIIFLHGSLTLIFSGVHKPSLLSL